ncbi:hypothetical protein BACI348_30235 [Bacillus altitudinis]|uniref:Uncharacterized protein n=1 Tax=Bacillus altitudinis TaxID=293387 RepID=A0A653MXZ1_BACAB|nr:hypothetical protein [Bacillus altitudinis]VXB09958.1 hypothetical protein BACI348_30235 [Bacillus altitudinis]
MRKKLDENKCYSLILHIFLLKGDKYAKNPIKMDHFVYFFAAQTVNVRIKSIGFLITIWKGVEGMRSI